MFQLPHAKEVVDAVDQLNLNIPTYKIPISNCDEIDSVLPIGTQFGYRCTKSHLNAVKNDKYLLRKKYSEFCTSTFMNNYCDNDAEFLNELKIIYSYIQDLFDIYSKKQNNPNLVQFVYKGGNVINSMLDLTNLSMVISENVVIPQNSTDATKLTINSLFGISTAKRSDWDFIVLADVSMTPKQHQDITKLLLLALLQFKKHIDSQGIINTIKSTGDYSFDRYINKIQDLLKSNDPELMNIADTHSVLFNNKTIDQFGTIKPIHSPSTTNKGSYLVIKREPPDATYHVVDIYRPDPLNNNIPYFAAGGIFVEPTNIDIAKLIRHHISDIYISYISDILLGSTNGEIHFELFRLKISNRINYTEVNGSLTVHNCPIEVVDISFPLENDSTHIEQDRIMGNKLKYSYQNNILIPTLESIIVDLLVILGQTIYAWDDYKYVKRLRRLMILMLKYYLKREYSNRRQISDDIDKLVKIINIEKFDDKLNQLKSIIGQLTSPYLIELMMIYYKNMSFLAYFKNQLDITPEVQQILDYISANNKSDGKMYYDQNHYFQSIEESSFSLIEFEFIVGEYLGIIRFLLDNSHLPVVAVTPTNHYNPVCAVNQLFGLIIDRDHKLRLIDNASKSTTAAVIQYQIPHMLMNEDFKLVEINQTYVMAVSLNGKLHQWNLNGSDLKSDLYPDQQIKKIAIGQNHFLVLFETGQITGQIFSLVDNVGQVDIPSQIQQDHNIIDIACGLNHSMALDTYGKVYVWGDNKDGVTKIPDVLMNIKSISAGPNYCVALDTNGMVHWWGSDEIVNSLNYWRHHYEQHIKNANYIQVLANLNSIALLDDQGYLQVWGTTDRINRYNLPFFIHFNKIKVIATDRINYVMVVDIDGHIYTFDGSDNIVTNLSKPIELDPGDLLINASNQQFLVSMIKKLKLRESGFLNGSIDTMFNLPIYVPVEKEQINQAPCIQKLITEMMDEFEGSIVNNPSFHYGKNLLAHSIWTSRIIYKLFRNINNDQNISGQLRLTDEQFNLMRQLVLDIDGEYMQIAVLAGFLHDIGKIGNENNKTRLKTSGVIPEHPYLGMEFLLGINDFEINKDKHINFFQYFKKCSDIYIHNGKSNGIKLLILVMTCIMHYDFKNICLSKIVGQYIKTEIITDIDFTNVERQQHFVAYIYLFLTLVKYIDLDLNLDRPIYSENELLNAFKIVLLISFADVYGALEVSPIPVSQLDSDYFFLNNETQLSKHSNIPKDHYQTYKYNHPKMMELRNLLVTNFGYFYKEMYIHNNLLYSTSFNNLIKDVLPIPRMIQTFNPVITGVYQPKEKYVFGNLNMTYTPTNLQTKAIDLNETYLVPYPTNSAYSNLGDIFSLTMTLDIRYLNFDYFNRSPNIKMIIYDKVRCVFLIVNSIHKYKEHNKWIFRIQYKDLFAYRYQIRSYDYGNFNRYQNQTLEEANNVWYLTKYNIPKFGTLCYYSEITGNTNQELEILVENVGYFTAIEKYNADDLFRCFETFYLDKSIWKYLYHGASRDSPTVTVPKSQKWLQSSASGIIKKPSFFAIYPEDARPNTGGVFDLLQYNIISNQRLINLTRSIYVTQPFNVINENPFENKLINNMHPEYRQIKLHHPNYICNFDCKNASNLYKNCDYDKPYCDILATNCYGGRRRLQEIFNKTRMYKSSKIYKSYDLATITNSDTDLTKYKLYHYIYSGFGEQSTHTDSDLFYLEQMQIDGFYSTDYNGRPYGEIALTNPELAVRYMDESSVSGTGLSIPASPDLADKLLFRGGLTKSDSNIMEYATVLYPLKTYLTFNPNTIPETNKEIKISYRKAYDKAAKRFVKLYQHKYETIYEAPADKFDSLIKYKATEYKIMNQTLRTHFTDMINNSNPNIFIIPPNQDITNINQLFKQNSKPVRLYRHYIDDNTSILERNGKINDAKASLIGHNQVIADISFTSTSTDIIVDYTKIKETVSNTILTFVLPPKFPMLPLMTNKLAFLISRPEIDRINGYLYQYDLTYFVIVYAAQFAIKGFVDYSYFMIPQYYVPNFEPTVIENRGSTKFKLVGSYSTGKFSVNPLNYGETQSKEYFIYELPDPHSIDLTSFKKSKTTSQYTVVGKIQIVTVPNNIATNLNRKFALEQEYEILLKPPIFYQVKEIKHIRIRYGEDRINKRLLLCELYFPKILTLSPVVNRVLSQGDNTFPDVIYSNHPQELENYFLKKINLSKINFNPIVKQLVSSPVDQVNHSAKLILQGETTQYEIQLLFCLLEYLNKSYGISWHNCINAVVTDLDGVMWDGNFSRSSPHPIIKPETKLLYLFIFLFGIPIVICSSNHNYWNEQNIQKYFQTINISKELKYLEGLTGKTSSLQITNFNQIFCHPRNYQKITNETKANYIYNYIDTIMRDNNKPVFDNQKLYRVLFFDDNHKITRMVERNSVDVFRSKVIPNRVTAIHALNDLPMLALYSAIVEVVRKEKRIDKINVKNFYHTNTYVELLQLYNQLLDKSLV